ncbi:MAG TPA: MFS transporter [Caulobacteraceae bacterium]|jgi:EmrB/QacA subfamily drug resistance transporter|nr:MFS transporter [Caulobacteraceae bacterium]
MAKIARESRLAALTVAGALFMEGFDSSMILTSLPRMAQDLGGTPISLSIAVTAYLLALAIFIPVSGWIADNFGARRVYCAAIIVFVIGSMACGLAPTVPLLVAGRFVQGIGGAMMQPIGRLILARSADKRDLISLMNYTIIPGLVGPSLGPVVGGFISAYANWRWNFFINLPIGLIGLVMTFRYIKPSPPIESTRFDWAGFLLVGSAASALTLAFETSRDGLRGLLSAAPWAASAVALTGAYVVYARRRPNAVMDLRLFKVRCFRISVLFGSMARSGVFTTQFLLPALLQLVFKFDAFRAGLLTFLVAAGTIAMRPVMNVLLKTFGFRTVLTGACVLSALMLAGFCLFKPPAVIGLLAAYIFVYGLVRTVVFSSLGGLALADIEPADMGRSNSVAIFAQRMSMSLGVSLAAASLSFASGGGPLDHGDFIGAFLFAAGLTFTAGLLMLQLRPDDGWRVSGYGGDGGREAEEAAL